MRHVEQSTIERTQRFLKVVQDSVGKDLDLGKVAKTFNLQNSAPFYARKLGFIDFKGKRILKVHYVKPEPKIARDLIDGMNRIKRENDANRKMKRELEAKALLPKPEPTKTPKEKPIEAKVVEQERVVKKQAEAMGLTQNKDPHHIHNIRMKGRLIIRFFGIRVGTVEEA